MARTRRRTRRRIVREAEAQLAASYTLVWLSYDDQLGDDQIARILAGDIESVEEEIEEWAAEYRWGRVREIIREVVGDEDFALLEGTADYDELRFAVEERDDSDLLAALARNTHPHLWRSSLDYDLAPGAHSWDEPTFVQAMRDMAESAGLDLVDHASALSALVENAPYGGTAYILWHGDTEEILTAVLDSAWDSTRAPDTISWSDPHLLVLDHMNGSGADAQVHGTIRLPFRPERVRLDAARGRGYTWTEVAGPRPGAYEATVTLATAAHHRNSTPGPGPHGSVPTPAITPFGSVNEDRRVGRQPVLEGATVVRETAERVTACARAVIAAVDGYADSRLMPAEAAA